MKKIIFVVFISLLSTLRANTDSSKSIEKFNSTLDQTRTYYVGGKDIYLNLTDTNYIEASDSFPSMFNMFVPENNRLLCGYITRKDFQNIKEGINVPLDSYILVEVSKEAERIECTPSDFKEAKSSFNKNSSNTISNEGVVGIDELNKKLKEINIQEIQLNNPVDLGEILSMKDAVAYGMIYKVSQGENSTNYICSMLLTRLQERMLFIYIYKKYEGHTTMKEIVSITEAYATHLLEVNPAKEVNFLTNFWQGLPKWVRNALIGGLIGLIYYVFKITITGKKEEEVKTLNAEKQTTDDLN